MILLDGHSLTQVRKIQAEAMSLQLKERDSTATMTPESMDGIGVATWLQDDREPGEGIVWRVRSVQQAFDNRTPQLQLEHVINTLKERILFGEHTPAMITGTVGATTCTARQAVEYILAQQSDWELGDFDYNEVSNPYKFDGDTLFEALETVTNSLEGAWWSYDTTVYPFLLNITEKDTDVQTEMRAGRNMKTIRRSIDKSGMFTRFYPIGRDDLHIDTEYVDRNTEIYGVISKTETDQSIDTKEELTRWANERLQKHAEPTVTIDIEGVELVKATGESMDRMQLGAGCRVPLPEFNTTITEQIVSISYADKIHQPENVKVTLSNSRMDVTKIIADAIKKSGKSGRGSARKDKEDHAWFEDTTEHVSMVAEGIIGVDAQGNPNWTRLSEFIADGEGLQAKVSTQIEGVTDRVATLEINENEIRTEVANAKSDLSSSIVQTAEVIRSEMNAANSATYSVIEQTATNINAEVRRRTRVFVQLTDPALVPSNNVREGDIWIKSIKMNTWDEMGSKSWTNSADFNWNQYSGSPQYVWDGSRWEILGDQGVNVEYSTRIEQTERNISLIAQALGAVDPSAIAEIDISAEAIQSAVSTAKSELYSVIRQTATNITSEVVNNIDAISTYVEQTASSMSQAVARKNKVFVQLTDPVYDAGVTVIEGDIWIKSAGNDNVKQTWTELSAKTWSSQNSTNWREYYEGYWYVRKNNKWEIMNAIADVVEIGTKLEQDEKHISLIARDVDEIHQEIGSSLRVTASEIRAEVHAAKSSLYSIISQTATSIRAEVANTKSELSSSITLTASSIRSEVNSAKSSLYSSITLTASSIRSEVNAAKSSLSSSITQTASSIRSEVNAAKSSLSSSITQTASSIRSEVNAAKSTMYSTVMQTATSVFSGVYNKVGDNFSTITQTANSISTSVNAAKSTLYSTIMQTATKVFSGVYNKVGDNFSTITQTANSISTSVNAAKSTLYTTIMQTATSVFSGVYNKVGDNFSTITQTANDINASVSSAKSALYSAINVTSTQISLKVGKGEVISSINQTSESITISASKINLSGYVKATDITADYLKAKIADMTGVTLNGVTVNSSAAFNGSLLVATGSDVHGAVYSSVKNALTDLQITRSGNTYTLQRKRFTDAEWVDVGNFSRAVTDWSYAWNNGQLTVTALPQNNSKAITGVKTAGSWSGRTYSGRVVYWDGTDDDGTTWNTGATFSLTAPAPSISITVDTAGKSTEPTGERIYSTAEFRENFWYTFTVSAGGATKVYKIKMTMHA